MVNENELYAGILYTTALDKKGNLIHISNAVKGENYCCPLCKKEFILKKSGKTGEGSRRPHFAHYQTNHNCTPEGVLHFLFKTRLIELLQKYKNEDRALPMNWKCNICGDKHSGNLLKKAASIKGEYNLEVCKPDIALLDEKENVFAVIEIVVWHKPEEKVLQYYQDNNIILIQINIHSENDLEHIEEKITNPDFVGFCLNLILFKTKLIELLQKYKSENKVLPMNWKCNICDDKHSGNLLKKVVSIRGEYNLEIYKPDIALLDEKENVFAVIEIHKPEKRVLQYYQDNNIILIQINIHSENDLEHIEEKITNPDFVDFCLRPKCKSCGKYKLKKEMIILTEKCDRCHRNMKICYIQSKDGCIKPNKFKEADILFAKEKGVLLGFSKIGNEEYVTNICSKCKKFISNPILDYKYIYKNDNKDNLPKYVMYYCENCD
jgi:phosphoheptose isomerase